MALHHSAYMSVKSGGKSKLDVVKTKKLAMYTSAVKIAVIESVKNIRNAFMGIASTMRDGK